MTLPLRLWRLVYGPDFGTGCARYLLRKVESRKERNIVENLQNLQNLNPGDFQKYLQGVDYPIGKDDLVSVAKRNGAPGPVVSKIESANIGQFNSPQDVMAAVQGS